MTRIQTSNSSEYLAGWISENQKNGYKLTFFIVTPMVPSGHGGYIKETQYHAVMEKEA